MPRIRKSEKHVLWCSRHVCTMKLRSCWPIRIELPGSDGKGDRSAAELADDARPGVHVQSEGMQRRHRGTGESGSSWKCRLHGDDR